jgi:hypothetical protein
MGFAVALLNIATALAAIASAFCWYRSSTTTVPHPHANKDGVYHDGTISLDGNDLFATSRAQGLWNKRAAKTASLAALLQAFVAGLSAWS